MSSNSSSEVKVACRSCGNLALSSEFKLDYAARAMVCSSCFKKEKEPVPVPEIRPPGWDEVDDELEKLNRQKKKERQNLHVRELAGTVKCIITCSGCSFKFKFDKKRFYPPGCPYCKKKVPLNAFKKPF